MQQNIRTLNLFEKFDADGSGALDSDELRILYNEQGINVTEDEIKLLYGTDKVRFTLSMFESMTKDKKALNNFRQNMKKLQMRLQDSAVRDRIRTYIPTTFDAMMVDFGARVERKELQTNLDKIESTILESYQQTADINKISNQIRSHADLINRIIEGNN